MVTKEQQAAAARERPGLSAIPGAVESGTGNGRSNGEPPVPPALDRILQHHRNREPERLALKYQRMRQSAFGFYRGSAHLFYQDLPARSPLLQGPPVWMTGDLHLENFGAYLGDNGLAYFDLSDFDDGVLGPATVELARFVTSVLIGARHLGVGGRESVTLAQNFLRTYTATLRDGRARWVERPTARGMVKDVLRGLKDRSRRALLDDRTETGGRTRRLVVDRKRALPLSEVARARIGAFMRKLAARQPDPQFFRLLDVARRIAGTASLGLPRFVLLVEGEGSPHGNYLLDLKFAQAPTPEPWLPTPQPAWRNQADRIVSIQQRAQAVSPALLQAVLVNRQPYVLRELQPTGDRLMLELWGGRIKRLSRVMATMGELAAWSHLRSGGRQGSATIDALIEFARTDGWQQEVVAHARLYTARVESDYREFATAFDGDLLGV